MVSYGDACRNVGVGWKSLLLRAYQNLPPGAHIAEVKQKWGLLRIYANYEKPKYIHIRTYERAYRTFNDLLGDLENESAFVCEMCGEPGSLVRLSGWLFVCCEKHRGK